MRRRLVIAFPYYENAGILRVHLETWLRYPEHVRREMLVVIADDGSPSKPAVEVVPADYPIEVQIYRIGVNLIWNQCGARNLAMTHVPEGWVLVTDADHVLEPEDADQLLALKVKESRYYVPARRLADGSAYKRHPNSYYLTRAMFWDAGGCDEDFQGKYGSDSTFRRAIAAVGQRVELPAPALTLYGRDVVPDASTTEWGRKDSPYHAANFPELRAKKHGGAYKAQNHLRFPWERVR